MIKIRLIFIAILFLFITFFPGSSTATTPNVVSTIDLNAKLDVSVLPLAVGVNYLDNRLYIATFNTNAGENEIIVIDSLSYNVIDTIRLAERNLFSQIKIEINPVSGSVYVATLDDEDNKIHLISKITNKITATIRIDDGIKGIAVNSATNKIYVVNRKTVTVTVIDGKTNKIIDVIKLQENIELLFRAEGIKVNPFTHRIYVLKDSTKKKPNPTKPGNILGMPMRRAVSIGEDIKEKEIIVIDGTTNQVIKSIKLDFNALTEVIDPHISNSIFSPNLFSDASFALSSVYKIEINPLTNRIYIYIRIINDDGDGFNSILVIDGSTNKIIETLDLSGIPGTNDMVAISPKTNRIYLNDPTNNTLKVIDGSSYRIVSEIKIGGSPYSIKVDPSTNLIYMAYKDYGNIKVINESGMNFTPSTFTVYPASAAYDSSFQDATVTLLDQNGNPLQGVEVKASANDRFATVFPPSMVTNGEGIAVFRYRFKFNTHTEENNNRKITFTANQQETFITNEE